MVPEWPMRTGTSSTLYPAARRSATREDCCVMNLSSWCRGVKHEWAQRGGTHIKTQSMRTKVA